MKLSIIGTGFISKAFLSIIHNYKDVELQYILTRRKIKDITDFPYHDKLTNNLDYVLGYSDIIFECSGDPDHANKVINSVYRHNIKITTMNCEFQVTHGDMYFHISECAGDQPGSFIELHNDSISNGFKPKAYINLKKYLNYNPTKNDMELWSKKQNISLSQVIAATDGTKVQFEQCLLANYLNLDIIQSGMLMNYSDSDKDIREVYRNILKDKPITDCCINKNFSKSVVILAEHDDTQKEYLSYYGMGNDSLYQLIKPYHLCHLEVIKTIRNMYYKNECLLNNGCHSKYNVFAIAKKKILKGTKISRAIGSFELRGEIRNKYDCSEYMPIGNIQNCIIENDIEAGQLIQRKDINYEL